MRIVALALVLAGTLVAQRAPAQAQPDSDALATGDFLFVLPDGETAVVLAELEDAPDEGRLELVGSRPHVRAGRIALALEDVPESVRTWSGVEVRLFSRGGVTCTATIERFEIRSRVISPDSADWGTDTTYSFDNGSTYLVGIPDGDCDSAVWGQRADAPAPAVHGFTPGAAPPTLGEEPLLAAFRGLPEYAEVATRNQSDGVDPFAADDWEHHDGAQPSFAHAPATPLGPLGFVGATAGIGCGELFGRLWALFALDDAGVPRVLATGHGDRGGYYRPLSLIVQPDGSPLLLFDTLSGRVLYRVEPSGVVEVRTLRSGLAHGC